MWATNGCGQTIRAAGKFWILSFWPVTKTALQACRLRGEGLSLRGFGPVLGVSTWCCGLLALAAKGFRASRLPVDRGDTTYNLGPVSVALGFSSFFHEACCHCQLGLAYRISLPGCAAVAPHHVAPVRSGGQTSLPAALDGARV